MLNPSYIAGLLHQAEFAGQGLVFFNLLEDQGLQFVAGDCQRQQVALLAQLGEVFAGQQGVELLFPPVELLVTDLRAHI